MRKSGRNEIILKMIELMVFHDPVGLIRMGAPEDEYDNEVEIIYSYLFGSGRSIELEELVSFCNWLFNYRFAGTKFRWVENPKIELFCVEVFDCFIESIKFKKGESDD